MGWRDWRRRVAVIGSSALALGLVVSALPLRQASADQAVRAYVSDTAVMLGDVVVALPTEQQQRDAAVDQLISYGGSRVMSAVPVDTYGAVEVASLVAGLSGGYGGIGWAWCETYRAIIPTLPASNSGPWSGFGYPARGRPVQLPQSAYVAGNGVGSAAGTLPWAVEQALYSMWASATGYAATPPFTGGVARPVCPSWGQTWPTPRSLDAVRAARPSELGQVSSDIDDLSERLDRLGHGVSDIAVGLKELRGAMGDVQAAVSALGTGTGVGSSSWAPSDVLTATASLGSLGTFISRLPAACYRERPEGVEGGSAYGACGETRDDAERRAEADRAIDRYREIERRAIEAQREIDRKEALKELGDRVAGAGTAAGAEAAGAAREAGAGVGRAIGELGAGLGKKLDGIAEQLRGMGSGQGEGEGEGEGTLPNPNGTLPGLGGPGTSNLSAWGDMAACTLPTVEGSLSDAPTLSFTWAKQTIDVPVFGKNPNPSWLPVVKSIVGLLILIGAGLLCARWIIASIGLVTPAGGAK